MTVKRPEDLKKEAFRLFEDGKYDDSLALCNRLIETTRDPALEVLAATNLFYLGKTGDAEVYFRDLARKMPGSSYVHSYLAKVLEQKGEDGALAEYAAAVYLDPGNQDALRNYAASLVARNDDDGALPVLRRLAGIGKNPEDILRLAAVLTRTGRPQDALVLFDAPLAGLKRSREYVEALIKAGDSRTAADTAHALYGETGETVFLRTYLRALAVADPDTAPDAYAAAVKAVPPDTGILLDFLNFLRNHNDSLRALTLVKKLPGFAQEPGYRLIECELYAELGDRANALPAYETLIREELATMKNPEALEEIIRSYRSYLKKDCPGRQVPERFLALVSHEVNAVCLLETARSYEERGNPGDARDWYYRAYRADYLHGGLPYAEFLARGGDTKESEKVMLYILSNVKKREDLGRIAGTVTKNGSPLCRMKRLVVQLIRRLEEQRPVLGSKERECLAAAYLSAAEEALGREDYNAGKQYCLAGLDVLPALSRNYPVDGFVRLLCACKEQAVTDRPALVQQTPEQIPPKNPIQDLGERLDLTADEKKILEFLCTHRKASEMDLRKLLNTRRVPGIVNRMVRKAAEGGFTIIVKKGMSAEGEVYEYAGT